MTKIEKTKPSKTFKGDATQEFKLEPEFAKSRLIDFLAKCTFEYILKATNKNNKI